MKPLYLTAAEVAGILGISRMTLWRYFQQGAMPCEINAAGHYVVPVETFELFFPSFSTGNITAGPNRAR